VPRDADCYSRPLHCNISPLCNTLSTCSISFNKPNRLLARIGRCLGLAGDSRQNLHAGSCLCMLLAARHTDQATPIYFNMVKQYSYCLSAILAASLLLSCAALARPHATVRQEPVFECANVVGAEPFNILVQRVVGIAENQAFLTSQSVDPQLHPTSVLSSGQWETQKPGKIARYNFKLPNQQPAALRSARWGKVAPVYSCCCCVPGCLARSLDGWILAWCVMAAARTDRQAHMG
jgi:hypothetical protein